MPRLLLLLTALVPLAGHAGDIHFKAQGWTLRRTLQAFEPRYVPPVSKGHLRAAAQKPVDGCVFVAGVRHCPLPRD